MNITPSRGRAAANQRHWDTIKVWHRPNLKASGTGNLWSEASEDNRCNSQNTKNWKPAFPRIKNGRLCLSFRSQVGSTPSLILSLLFFYLVTSLLNSVCPEWGDYTQIHTSLASGNTGQTCPIQHSIRFRGVTQSGHINTQYKSLHTANSPLQMVREELTQNSLPNPTLGSTLAFFFFLDHSSHLHSIVCKSFSQDFLRSKNFIIDKILKASFPQL